MPLGQGWLNAWVKVNSKHVVFPPSSKGERDGEKEDVLNKSNGKSQRGSRSVTTVRTATSEDVETQAIRRFNHRKNRRRLQRTVSATDLMRDKAGKGKADKKSNQDFQEVLEKSSSTQATNDGKERISARENHHEQIPVTVPQHEDPSIVSAETEGSVRFVAGFFGADIESLEAGASQQLQLKASSVAMHDAASVQGMGNYSRLDTASVKSRGGQSLPARPLPRSESNDSGSKGGIGIRFPPNLFSVDSNAKGNCRHCSKLEAELQTSREDLEYLRGMAIRSEYICATCQTEPCKRLDNSAQSTSTTTGVELMNEMNERHEAKTNILIQERARWQQETHAKIQKYASLCKDLNEEAALRNEEALELHNRLDAVKAERDKMATELEEARVLMAQYEKNEQERQKSDLILKRYEQHGLDGADRAVQVRDSIIVDLSGRLEKALDMLQFEREQQRQRRQIIFPTQRASQSLDGRGGEDLEVELKSTKDSLRESQFEVESLKREADKKEVEWKMKLENLQRQLDAARSN